MDARPEDARELLPDILAQEDSNAVGNDLCELIDDMMGPDVSAEQDLEIPEKAGHMSQDGAVDILMEITSALHRVLEEKHEGITKDNLAKFAEYEERASKKIVSANWHADQVQKKLDASRGSQGSFRSADRRVEGI